MNKAIISIIFFGISILAMAQTQIVLTVGDKTMKATLADNAAARELTALLSNGPITIDMNDYGGFEKVGALPRSFTTFDRQITAEPGDIMLYQGRNMVIFYGSNSWSYTRLGRIDGATADNVKSFLGQGSISLKISLPDSSEISEIESDTPAAELVYDLDGRLVTRRPLKPGLYIINDRKTIVKG